eukprot:2814871-Rhodomonas_salina.2
MEGGVDREREGGKGRKLERGQLCCEPRMGEALARSQRGRRSAGSDAGLWGGGLPAATSEAWTEEGG